MESAARRMTLTAWGSTLKFYTSRQPARN